MFERTYSEREELTGRARVRSIFGYQVLEVEARQIRYSPTPMRPGFAGTEDDWLQRMRRPDRVYWRRATYADTQGVALTITPVAAQCQIVNVSGNAEVRQH